MSSGGNIKAFMQCGPCVRAERVQELAIGLVNTTTMRIWCDVCDRLVADFELAKPQRVRCDVCGEDIGPDHVH